MHVKIATVKRGSKRYRYAQLVESYRRKDGMSTQRVVANLGARTDLEIANIRQALAASREGQAVVLASCAEGDSSYEILDNLDWLDVAVVVEVMRRMGVHGILSEVLGRDEAEVPDADVTVSLVVQRCVDPDSKYAAVEWFGRTALPELLGLPMSRFNNTRIHRALVGLEAAEQTLQERLASAIHAHQGNFTLLFLDLTDTWFVGRGPLLATPGKTKEGLYRRKIGIALLCNQDGYPLRWEVVEGRRHDSGPMKELAWSLQALPWAKGVPLVLDRAMGATAHIEELLATGRPFITALCRNEFDAYTDRVPYSGLSSLPWDAAEACRQAREAVEQAGMERLSDDLYVLDLEVVTRKVPKPPAHKPPIEGTDKCRDRLAAAQSMQAALDSGQAQDLADAGRPHGFSAPMACKTLRLLRLAPDLQQSIADGQATMLSLSGLFALTRLDDFEAQRKSFEDVRSAARAKPDGRRSRKAGKLTAAPPKPPTESTPPKLHAVVAFNPEQWVRQKQSFDKLLGELRAWTRRKNDGLRDPRASTTATKLRQSALARLARNHMVDACKVEVSTETIDGRDVLQLAIEPDEDVCRRRQRFFGFQIIVARPDDRRSAADLVAAYRAKDAVEKDFQTIKSVLSLRPVRHRTDSKVRAHVTLCMLALLVERYLDHALRGQATGVAALDTLSDIHLNRVQTRDDSRPVYTITRPKADHIALLEAMDMTHLTDNTQVTATLYAR